MKIELDVENMKGHRPHIVCRVYFAPFCLLVDDLWLALLRTRAQHCSLILRKELQSRVARWPEEQCVGWAP